MYNRHSSLSLPQSTPDKGEMSTRNRANTANTHPHTQAHTLFILMICLVLRSSSQGFLPLFWSRKKTWLNTMFPERLRNHLPYCLGTPDCQMENGKPNVRNTEKCRSQRGMFRIYFQATAWRKWWFSWKHKGCDEQTLYHVKEKVPLAPAHCCEQRDWW